MPWETYGTREAWLAARRTGIGSSDAAALWGRSRFRTPLKVWAEKRGAVEDDATESRFIKAGRFLEPAVVAWFSEETGLGPRVRAPAAGLTLFRRWVERQAGGRFSLLATPDRIISAPTAKEWVRLGVAEPPDGDGILEIKTTSATMVEAWGDEPPLEYQIQVQHQMLTLGYEWAIIVCLIGGNDLRWFLVRIDEPFVERHLARCEAFWADVATGKEPEAVEGDVEILRRIHKRPEQKEVHLSSEKWDRLDARYAASKANIEADTEIVKDTEAALIQAMFRAGANVAVLPSGASYSLSVVEHKAQTIERKAYTTTTLRRRKPKE